MYIDKISVLNRWYWVIIVKARLVPPIIVDSSCVVSLKGSLPWGVGVALTCDNVSSRILIGLGSLASIFIEAGDGGCLGGGTSICWPLLASNRSFLSCLWGGFKSLMMTTFRHFTGSLLGINLALSSKNFLWDLSLRITFKGLILWFVFLPSLKEVTIFTLSSPSLEQILLKSTSSACLFTAPSSLVCSGKLNKLGSTHAVFCLSFL